MRVIETKYAGVIFRSRLEARWAVAFDVMGINWSYEDEGYSFGGVNYLPDFVLTLADKRLFCEIKPRGETSNKINLMAEHYFKENPDDEWTSFTTLRQLLRPRDFNSFDDNDSFYEIRSRGWDNFRRFCSCRTCGRIGFEFEGRCDRMRCCLLRSDHDDHNRSLFDEKFMRAFETALSYRF